MTDQEALEYVIGCLAEIRESERQWGVIDITVEQGKVKFVNIQKAPKYKLENGQLVDNRYNGSRA